MEQTQLQPPLPEESGSGEFVRHVLRIARRYRWWILLAGLTTLVAAVAVLSHLPSTYVSEATILIVEQQIPQTVVAPLSTAPLEQTFQTMTQEALSRARLIEIMDEMDLFPKQRVSSPDEAVDLMRKAITIQRGDLLRDGSFSSFSISFVGRTPELAQEGTRKLSSLFIERHSETEVSRANTTTNFIHGQLTDKRKTAADLEQRIQAFKTQFAGELPDDRMFNETRLTDLRTQLQTTLSNLSRSRQQRIVLESMLTGNLSARHTRLKDERAALLTRFTQRHPDVLSKDEEIAQVESALAAVQTGVERPVARLASSDPVIAQLQGQLESNRLESDDLSKDQKRLDASIADYQRHLSVTPTREQQLAAMTRESNALGQEIEGLEKMDQQSALSADMEKREEGQQFRLINPASFPIKPSSPKRLMISLGALVGGIALGLLVALLIESRKPSFQSERQLRRLYAPPIILSVPVLPTRAEQRKRRWRVGCELVTGSMVTAVMFAIEYYFYKHP